MLICAVRVPTALGSNCTVKLVEPLREATGVVGWAVTLKSPGWLPPILTRGLPVRFRSPEPLFLMVNVRLAVPPATPALPKSL